MQTSRHSPVKKITNMPRQKGMGMVYHTPGQPAEWREQKWDAPAPGEVRVQLTHSALNHRDLWILQGKYPNIATPCILGSDGTGTVAACGNQAGEHWLGKQVLINPGLFWGNRESHQGSDFQILGMPRNGTFAEYVNVPVEQLHPVPPHLSPEEAGALPLAGVTAYRSLFTRAGLCKGEKILITGIGGGVASMALAFGVACGAEVWVTSSREDKIKQAVKRGARGGAVYSEPDWETSLKTKAFHVIFDSSGGASFEKLIDLLAPGGRLVFCGATAGNPESFPLRKVFWKQLSVLGSTMGSPGDFSEMLAFVSRHKLRPVIDSVLPIQNFEAGCGRMSRGELAGKVVFRLGDPQT